MIKKHGFLPMNKKEMKERGWEQADFVYICGDAYVDHPSFGAAIITRLLEDAGYKVAFIAQPDWNDESSIAVCGEPRLAFIVSAGNMDSMVNHYTSFKKRRHQDANTPGGGFSGRPNRPTIVYSNLIRKTYKKTPILLGGIEASLRRLAHYDYWSDKVKRSVLLVSGAELLMYGLGEHSILEIAEALDSGIAVQDITYIRGTVFKCRDLEELSSDYELLPSYEEITESKETFAQSYYRQYVNTDAITAKRLVEPYKKKEYLVQNPPSLPLTQEEMDHVYELPYMRAWHPSYDKLGGVPALKEIKFSLTSNRGCFGGCSFCALTFHQGRRIQVRSQESIIKEAELILYNIPTIPEEVLEYVEPVVLDLLVGELTMVQLMIVFQEVMRRQTDKVDPVRSKFGKIEKEEVSLTDKFLYVRDYLQEHRRFSFRQLLQKQKSKMHVVVTFLAILEMKKLGDRWKTQPIGGEITWNWGDLARFKSFEEVVSDKDTREYVMEQIRNLHCNHLGGITWADFNEPEFRKNAEILQKAMGFRFIINEFSYPKEIKVGAQFPISFKVVNSGSSPFYYNWPVEVSLLVPESHQKVWGKILEEVNISEWMPGDNWSVDEDK